MMMTMMMMMFQAKLWRWKFSTQSSYELWAQPHSSVNPIVRSNTASINVKKVWRHSHVFSYPIWAFIRDQRGEGIDHSSQLGRFHAYI